MSSEQLIVNHKLNKLLCEFYIIKKCYMQKRF